MKNTSSFFDIIGLETPPITANKKHITPSKKLSLYTWDACRGWSGGGYAFKEFLADVYFYLGEVSTVKGVQYIIHHYYLQNGSIDAKTTAGRIQKFLASQ